MTTALAEREETALERMPAEVTPMSMLQLAVQQGADLEKLQKLMDLQEWWEKNEARKAFVQAITKFKETPPEIHKNKRVHYQGKDGRANTDYMHATLDNVCEQIIAGLSAVGISHKWTPHQTGAKIKVSCVLTHVAGHSESTELEADADASGGKNSIQAIASTVTYLERYTLLAATGIAVKGQDDDGRGAGRHDVKPDEAGKKALEGCGSLETLKKAWASLTEDQRKTLTEVMSECRRKIREADAA